MVWIISNIVCVLLFNINITTYMKMYKFVQLEFYL